MKKLLVSPEGEQLVDLTAEEITAKEAADAEEIAKIQARKEAAEVKETNKTSGKAKLKSGDPLTDEEIEALFG